MKRTSTFLLGISLFFCLTISGQIDTAIIGRIRHEALSSGQTYKILASLSDEYGLRLTWSDGFIRAGDFALSKFKEWKIDRIDTESYPVQGKNWSVNNYYAQVTEPGFMPLLAYPKIWTPGTNGNIESDVVYLDARSEADFAKYKGRLKGKVVLIADQYYLNPVYAEIKFTRQSDTELTSISSTPFQTKEELQKQKSEEEKYLESLQLLSKKVKFCKEEGAALLLDPSRSYYGIVKVVGVTSPVNPTTLMDFWYRLGYDPRLEQPPPQMKISLEQYNHIMRLIKKDRKVVVKAAINVSEGQLRNGYNIIAEIPGTELKNEIVEFGAQFDSFDFGESSANNGAGVAVSMEALRILKSIGFSPRRTIRLCLWSGSQEYQLGSKDHVKRHFFNGSKESCYLYFNNITGGRYRGIYTLNNKNCLALLAKWMEYINDPGFRTTTLMSNGERVDNLSYDRNGIPGFDFVQDELDFEGISHSNMDVIERIPREDMKQNAYILASLIYIASMTEGHFPAK